MRRYITYHAENIAGSSRRISSSYYAEGNYGQSVFESENDYLPYLRWFKKYCQEYFLKIWAYCLMSNHVHFIAVPMREDSLARTFNTLHMRYSQYFNQKKNMKGHLWQGRFYSSILDERHLYAAIRYIEKIL
jgi:putative transposase